MIKRSVGDMQGRRIEGEGIRGVTMRLLVGREDGAPTFATRHFSVDPGGFTPKHSHDWEHEVVVLSGDGELEHNGQVHSISDGDALYIAPGSDHQFRNTGEGPLEFLCVVPVTSLCGDEVPGS
ncbi:MAG: cupin domain-containing protein [Phycisphaerales bacterium]|jgi:quercetin dioxygenase-like cupin family protein|nr:cupin domain-containing protein [Phycisphaerales bacterium]MDP6987073.1 cupin domain-containing protein [Phycisphaerales bacterium]